MNINYKKYIKYFSKENFWEKLKKVFKKIGIKATSYILILYYILQSDKVSISDKLLITGYLGYFILPVDFLPDFIPFFGYNDDIIALIFALKRCLKYVDDGIKEKAVEKLQKWFKVDEKFLEDIIKNI